MEAAGLAATCVSLLGAVTQLVKFSHNFCDAPEELERYCSLLKDLYQLLRVIESLKTDLDGPNPVPVTQDGREYGLVAFCVNNAQTALKDAVDLLKRFKQEGNAKLFRIRKWLHMQSKRLLFVLQEQDIQGRVHRVEIAIAGLGIAIHAASLARTNAAYVFNVLNCKVDSHLMRLTSIISHEENKKAVADLSRQLAENFEKLDISYDESLDRQRPKEIHLVVRSPPCRPRGLGAFPWPRSRGKRTRQSQAVKGSPIESLSELAMMHKTPRVNTLSAKERHLAIGDVVSSEPPDDQMAHVSEIGLEALSHVMPPFPNKACEEPPLGKEANDIRITCEDGSVALIPGGSVHEDSHESIETSNVLIKMTDKQSVHPSDAEQLLKFLAKSSVPDRMPTPDGKTSTKSVNIGSIFEFEFVSPKDEDDIESMKSDSSILPFLCVERLLLDDHFIPSIYARGPCDNFPWCDHTTIGQLDGGMSASELFASDMGYIMFAPHDEGHDTQPIRPYKGFDASVYERCTEPCGHTRVEENEEDNGPVHCMMSISLFSMIGTFPEDSDIDDDSEDEVDMQGGSPVGPVPCLFCRKAALNPEEEGVKESKSVVSYGCHTYGYKCARCQKISWITGARQAGFEEESDQNEEESDQSDEVSDQNDEGAIIATNAATITAAQVVLPLLKRLIG